MFVCTLKALNTILIVNVASACGFTPQYEGLQSMYEKYKDKGLEILAFPCNQFGGQESGTNEEIKNFCDTKYNVSFKLFDKVEVKGENASPLFNFLTEKAGRKIQWNFTKFLINKNGEFVKGFGTQKTQEMIEEIPQLFVIKTELSNIIPRTDGTFSYNEEIISMKLGLEDKERSPRKEKKKPKKKK